MKVAIYLTFIKINVNILITLNVQLENIMLPYYVISVLSVVIAFIGGLIAGQYLANLKKSILETLEEKGQKGIDTDKIFTINPACLSFALRWLQLECKIWMEKRVITNCGEKVSLYKVYKV